LRALQGWGLVMPAAEALRLAAPKKLAHQRRRASLNWLSRDYWPPISAPFNLRLARTAVPLCFTCAMTSATVLAVVPATTGGWNWEGSAGLKLTRDHPGKFVARARPWVQPARCTTLSLVMTTNCGACAVHSLPAFKSYPNWVSVAPSAPETRAPENAVEGLVLSLLSARLFAGLPLRFKV